MNPFDLHFAAVGIFVPLGVVAYFAYEVCWLLRHFFKYKLLEVVFDIIFGVVAAAIYIGASDLLLHGVVKVYCLLCYAIGFALARTFLRRPMRCVVIFLAKRIKTYVNAHTATIEENTDGNNDSNPKTVTDDQRKFVQSDKTQAKSGTKGGGIQNPKATKSRTKGSASNQTTHDGKGRKSFGHRI